MLDKCGIFHTSYAQEDRLFKTFFIKSCLAAFLVLLCVSPLVLNDFQISILIFINIAIIGAAALNVLTGYCGQISLGHGAFMGVGAYASAILANHGVPFLMAITMGGAVAAMVGMVFGIPSLRLKGIYLAIATLAAQIILEYVFLRWESVTGGFNGMSVAPAQIFGFTFDTEPRMFYLSLGMAVVVLILVTNIVRSRPGRAFVAVRDFYLSAEIVGVNLFRTKLAAFGISSFFAGVAGALWGHYSLYVNPEMFNISLSITYLSMIIIGGLGSVLGSIFGAVFLTVLPELLTLMADFGSGYFPDIHTHLQALRQGVFGLVLVLFLIFEPEGLVHRWRLIKAYFKLYPFAY